MSWDQGSVFQSIASAAAALLGQESAFFFIKGEANFRRREPETSR